LVKISLNRMVIQRVYRIKAMVKVDTQKIRETLLQNLQELFSLAKKQAQNNKLQLPQRQKWVRVASYVAQVMNSLTKSFDEAQITKDLANLEKMINEAMAKEENRGNQTPN
jgi:ArsR family metal-binding transcriptional regulator